MKVYALFGGAAVFIVAVMGCMIHVMTSSPASYVYANPAPSPPVVDNRGTGAQNAEESVGSNSESKSEPSCDDPNLPPVEDDKKNVSRSDDEIYEIIWGDTLSELSLKFGVSVDALANYNQIRDPNLIYAGSALRIPGKRGE